MEHDQKPPHHQTESQADDRPKHKPDGCGMLILKVIAGVVVLFIVAFALVFGVCLMG